MNVEQPINNIQWVDVEDLNANEYNPNVVQSAEMKLLELSIVRNGWIHPIIINKDMTIIDGFHRSTLAKTSKKIQGISGRKVPAVILDLTEAERMLLTIRINRAKGSHVAFRMADIVKKLIHEYDYSPKEVAKQIGANKEEIDLLLQEDIFKKLDIENHTYSKAWIPK